MTKCFIRAGLCMAAAAAIAGCQADGSRGDEGSSVAPVVGAVADPLVVPTDHGLVRGKIDQGVPAYLGIPYAKPPVGDLRFRAPQPIDQNWSGVRDATQYASACLQLLPQKGTFGSEDCLYLNVFTPPGSTPGAKKKVMFWLYGGGFNAGAGDQDLIFNGTGNLYHGATFAKEQDVVVVTMNYRIAELGFLALPELSAEDPHGSSGNQTILDQIAALQWVHDNIANFGGDPGQVTIFGESAGAVSVGLLLVSPLASGLFSAAIMESGGLRIPPREVRYQDGANTVARAGCSGAKDVLACLRAQPGPVFLNPAGQGLLISKLFVQQIQDGHMWWLWYGPNVDNYVFTGDAYDTMRAGKHNKVPLIVGNNREEAALIPALGTDYLSYEATIDLAAAKFASQVKQRYPYFTPLPNGRKAIVDMGTDVIFGCDERRVARNALLGGTPVVYRYVWSHGYRPPHVLSALDGAFHGAEFPFIWNTTDAFLYTQDADEQLLGTRARSYWTHLISGNVNAPGLPEWPAYDLKNEKTQLLDTTIATTEKYRDDFCNFWDDALGLH